MKVDRTGATLGSAAFDMAAHRAAGFELADVLRILTEGRKVILLAGALGLLLAFVASILMTPLYRATALLELNSPANEVIESANVNSRTERKVSSPEMLATQMGLLRSETLAHRVAEDLNLVSAPEFGGTRGTREQRTEQTVANIRNSTKVEAVKGAMLIQVSYTAADPLVAAKLANALAEGFISSSLERRYDSSSYARKFLSDQLARTKVALEDSERGLNSYSINSGLFRTPGQVVDGKTAEGATLAVTDLAAMNSALNEARVRRIAAEEVFRGGGTVSEADLAANTGEMVAQRGKTQADYAEGTKLFKPDYPQMRQLGARIARLDNAISGERDRVHRDKRGGLKREFEAARRGEAELTRLVSAAKERVQSERSRSIQYSILQREADTNRQLYEALLQRYKEIGVAGGIGMSNVSIVDLATPPQSPYRPNWPVNFAVGLLLGLAAGVGLAFAIHLLFDNIIDPGDVRSKLHLPVLGVIPMEEENRTLQEALFDRKSDISEAYYSTLTALKFARPEGLPRTLFVTSSRPGEGKSTSAFAIASSMARLGSKVLLIDSDLRKPTFLSNRRDQFGLAHLLGSEDPLAEFVQATQIDRLSLLPVGRFTGSAAELLSSARLPGIILEASREYDHVVIDGPPVLGLTDAPLLGSVAEVTVIVVESRESRTSSVLEMVRRLQDAGSNVIGVILTKLTRTSAGYGYQYAYHNYSTEKDAASTLRSDVARTIDIVPADP